jgi:predicted ATPase
MGKLSLAFLGQPEVRVVERAVTFPTRKAFALLAYLAVEGVTHARQSHAFSRETLTAMFWPASAAAPGRATLRSTLAFLRNALGDAASHIVADRETVRFDPGPDTEVDLLTLAAAAQATRQLPILSSTAPTANLRHLLAQLQTAARLYRGDFLEGFSLSDAPDFDEWASLQREAAHRQAALVFDWLSQLQFEGGETPDATATVRQWLKHDALNESAHRRLMQLLFAAGDRAAALEAYQACRALFARELNAEPSSETETLVERIKADRVSEVTVGRAASASPSRLVTESPLVGRAAQHIELVAAYRSARRGRAAIVTLEGEPGIGKTRLAREFLAWASAQGAEILQGRAIETSGQLAYQPVVEALRSALTLPHSLSPTWLAELSRLLPELTDRYPNLHAPLALAEAEARTRLFEAVARYGQAIANRAPVVLFIDDLQWADAASLDLLAYAVRRWLATAAPVLMLFAARSEDLAALADWLTGLGRDASLTRLTLGPLTLEDTRQLVEILTTTGEGQKTIEPPASFVTQSGRPSSLESFGEQVFIETGGHPFFIVQTLKSLSERDLLQRNEAGEWTLAADFRISGALPAGIAELIRSRLSRLGADARTAASAGAALGNGFEFKRLCRVADVDEAKGLAAVEELSRRGLWRESAARYFFTHDKIREVAYAEVSEARRHVLHRRALSALEEAQAPPAELARHALAADEREAAFRYSVAAGDDAMRLFAVRNAIAHYTQAQSLREASNLQLPASAIHHLVLHLGRAYELANDWAAARATYEALLAQARAQNQPVAECAALNQLALAAAKSAFDIPTAARLLQEAQRAAEASGDKLALAETEMNLSQMGLYRWDASMMVSHGEHALALARELNQPDLAARCLNMLAYSGVLSGEWEGAVPRAEESRALYAALGNRVMEADSLSLVGAFRAQQGQLREAITLGRAAHAICLDVENEWGQANNAYHLALALSDIGEYAEALDIAQKGVAAARVAGHPPLLVFNITTVGSVQRALMNLDAARAAHAEAQAIAEALQHPFLMELTATESCADEALAENWAGALAHARQALALRDRVPTLFTFVSSRRWHETEALLRAGGADAERAIEDLRRFDQQTADRSRYRLSYLRAAAVLAAHTPLSMGEGKEVREYLQEAASLADSLHLPGELWQIYAALGETDRAREIVQSLAAKIDDERLRTGFLVGTKNVC